MRNVEVEYRFRETVFNEIQHSVHRNDEVILPYLCASPCSFMQMMVMN